MKHSKITAIVLALCMLVTLMVVPVSAATNTPDAAGNYLTDGSFEALGEDGGVWDEYPQWYRGIPGGVATLSTTTEQKLTGAYSAKFFGAENTNKGQFCIYQNAGQFEAGTLVKCSVQVKVVTADPMEGETPLFRILARKSGTSTGVYIDPCNINYSTLPADWTEYSIQTRVTETLAAEELYFGLELYKFSNFEVYMDDFKVEVVDETEVETPVVPAAGYVVNGDFETGDLTGWELSKAGVSPTVLEDASGNHYVEFDMSDAPTTQEGIKCQLQGLTPGKKYAIYFDVCTSGAFFHLDGAGGTLTSVDDPGIGGVFSSMSTDGDWQAHGYEWKQPEGKTTLWIRFILWGNTGFVQGTDYVRLDDITVREIDAKNLIINSSFEYGLNGLGYKGNTNGFIAGAFGSYNFTTADVYSQVKGGVDGKYAMQISRPAGSTGWNGLRKQASTPQYQYTVELGCPYVYSAYVKNINLTDDADGKAVTLYSNKPDTGEVAYSAADLPVGQWKCIQFVKTHNEAPVFDVRVYGTGTVLIDNVSCYKLDKAFATYANAAGNYSASLVDGGKAIITMPAVEGDAGNIVALAVYSEAEGTRTLKSLKTKMIEAEDITTAGYIQFELTADTLVDFASANYIAKLMTLKNGVLVPLQDVILYTKAQEV